MKPPARLDDRLWFPDPRTATPEGLVAAGGDLSPARLLLAYRSGIFPWTARPLTWWSPDPRGIFELDQFHIPRSLERTLRRQKFAVTHNQAFAAVIHACATVTNRGPTWITPEFITAYTRLHELGHAHSVECWLGNQLAGGVYGVAVGGLFAGESMFHHVSDASKVALHFLHGRLRERDFALFDIQMLTSITRQLGGQEISRTEYLRRLEAAVRLPCTFL